MKNICLEWIIECFPNILSAKSEVLSSHSNDSATTNIGGTSKKETLVLLCP